MDTLLRIALTNTAWAAGLAALAWCAARLCRRTPAIVHVLWLAVLLKLVTPSLLAIARPRPTHPQRTVPAARAPRSTESVAARLVRPSEATRPATVTTTATAVDSERPTRPALWTWRPLVAGAWLAGMVVWWVAVGVHVLRFRRFRRAARPAPAALCARAEQIALQMGMHSGPALALVPARVPPMLWALCGRPWLLLPELLWERLSPAQQDTVLAHELAHLKRRDHWVRRLEVLVLGLYWWNPLAWWTRRQIEQAEEPCCDAWVTWALPGSAGDYAEALLATAGFLSEPRTVGLIGASGVGRLPLLKWRLIMLMSDSAQRPSARLAPKAFLLLLAVALPLLPVWTVRGDDESKEKATRPAAAPKEAAPLAESGAEGPAPRPGGSEARYVHPVEQEITDYAIFQGWVEPSRTVELRPRVSGAVMQVNFQAGSMVKRGDLLFQIDARVAQAELTRADAEFQRVRARLQRARAAKARAELGHRRNTVSDAGVEEASAAVQEAEAEADAAQATRELAHLNLEMTRVKAPIDGRIDEPLLTEGNLAVADKTRLATIVALDYVHVAFSVDERSASQIRRLVRTGKIPSDTRNDVSVVMQLSDETNFPHSGKVVSLDTPFDPGTRTTPWRAVFSNPNQILTPGRSAMVRIPTTAPYKALLVPRSALFKDNEGLYVSVWSEIEGKPEKRRVEFGSQHDDLIVVRKGRLTPQDRVYTRGPAER